MKPRYFWITALLLGLTACSDSNPDETSRLTSDVPIENELVVQLGQEALPDDAPEVGTAIKDLVKPTASGSQENADISQIMWEDLIPEGFEPAAIMQKYQAEIDAIPEGAPEERELFDKIMAEFNNAPANEALSGKQVRIPGFVSPLEEHNGVVGEFLLVPYFGSCIHSPPPPVNQTVLVKPEEGKSITLEQIYNPVWVTGHMKVELSNTDLAQAGYLIEDAALELYTEENAIEE